MIEGVTYRWLDNAAQTVADQDWQRVEKILQFRGWMSLNRNTSRILLAEDHDGVLVGFFVFQLIPHVGPLWLHPSLRGQGVADEMAREMWEFLVSVKARGWIASAETPHGARLCEMFGMDKIEHPMYIMIGMEKVS